MKPGRRTRLKSLHFESELRQLIRKSNRCLVADASSRNLLEVKIGGYQQGAKTKTCGCQTGLNARVSRANNDNIVGCTHLPLGLLTQTEFFKDPIHNLIVIDLSKNFLKSYQRFLQIHSNEFR